MFNYMTDLDGVDIDPACCRTVVASGARRSCVCLHCLSSRAPSGHDMISLVFNVLDEFLYLFCSEGIVVKDVKVVELDVDAYRIRCSW